MSVYFVYFLASHLVLEMMNHLQHFDLNMTNLFLIACYLPLWNKTSLLTFQRQRAIVKVTFV